LASLRRVSRREVVNDVIGACVAAWSVHRIATRKRDALPSALLTDGPRYETILTDRDVRDH
jgi:hypothetical protein